MKLKDFKNIHASGKDLSKVITQDKVIWSEIDDVWGAPGPEKLIGGNMEAGFFGEVNTLRFISGTKLAQLIGLKAGVAQNSTEPWLKFAYMGKIVFVAKKVFRHSISWDDLNAVNAIFGNKTISVDGQTYKVMLMKGKNEGTQNDITSYEGSIVHNSMWNKLMIPISSNDDWDKTQNIARPVENWNIGYTSSDLWTNWREAKSLGIRSWCQDKSNEKNWYVVRGDVDVSSSFHDVNYAKGVTMGWRPVLELVQG